MDKLQIVKGKSKMKKLIGTVGVIWMGILSLGLTNMFSNVAYASQTCYTQCPSYEGGTCVTTCS